MHAHANAKAHIHPVSPCSHVYLPFSVHLLPASAAPTRPGTHHSLSASAPLLLSSLQAQQTWLPPWHESRRSSTDRFSVWSLHRPVLCAFLPIVWAMRTIYDGKKMHVAIAKKVCTARTVVIRSNPQQSPNVKSGHGDLETMLWPMLS